MSNRTGNRNQHGELEKCGGGAMRISENVAEILLLRKQLESLKQELDCECQVTQVYREELKEQERELRCVENELSTVVTLQMLRLEQAKKLAKNIVKSKMSVSESLANLLSAIYNSTVKPDKLTPIDRRSFKIKPARRSARLTTSEIKLEALPSKL